MKEFQPLVSVIINCFNGETYLREAIDSVITQTYTNWEIIFWDNQSTDSTKEIVHRYNDTRIKYYYAECHTALGEARNLGVEKATGEYINFLDADDVWDKNKLEEQVKLLIPGEVEVVYTPFDIICTNPTRRMLNSYKRLKRKAFSVSEATYNQLLLGNFIIFSRILLNKALYHSVGGIDTTLQQNEDYQLLLKLSLQTKIRRTEVVHTFYRIHSSNASIDCRELSIKENRLIYSQLPNSPELNTAIGINELKYVYVYLKNKHYGIALRHLFKVFDFTIFVKYCKSRL